MGSTFVLSLSVPFVFSTVPKIQFPLEAGQILTGQAADSLVLTALFAQCRTVAYKYPHATSITCFCKNLNLPSFSCLHGSFVNGV